MYKNSSEELGTEEHPENHQEDEIEDEDHAENPEQMNEDQEEQDDQDDQDPEQKETGPEAIVERVSEETDIPSDKDSLIEYLKAKLEKTQTVIDDAFNHLQKEKQTTANMLLDLDDHKRELKKIHEAENKPVKEKIHKKVEETLEKVIEQKVEAENARNELKNAVDEKQMLFDELESMLNLLQGEDEEKQNRLSELQNRINEYDVQIEELSRNKQHLEDEAIQKDQQIKQLLKEKEDMRGAMAKLSDTRNVLNRQLANPEQLYSNEGLDQRQDRGHKDLNKGSSNSQSNNFLPNIKKQNYLVNEDDFWHADPTKQSYAKDYGGRNNNYNEQYKYNSQKNKEFENANSPQAQKTDDAIRKSLSGKFDALPQIHTEKVQTINVQDPRDMLEKTKKRVY